MSNTESTNSTQAAGSTSSASKAAETPTTPKGKAGDYTAATPISSLADLKEKAPTLYKSMMQGIAQTIIGQMRDSQARLKESMRRNRNP